MAANSEVNFWDRILHRWLTDFPFTDVATAEQQIDWSKAPMESVWLGVRNEV